MASTPGIVAERRGPALWIALDRPQARNALTMAMYAEVARLMAGAGDDATLRAVVVTGTGPHAFSSGTAIETFRDLKSEADALAYEAEMDRVMRAIETCAVPTIAAMQGACTGGGAAIALACDLRLATSDLRFGFPIARTLGNCLSIANLSRLVALVGRGRATEMLLTARLVEATEAKAIGLAGEILPDVDALHARAGELAETLSGHAPITLVATREALRRLLHSGPGAEDRDLILRAYTSGDFQEGVEAFLARRKPAWKGT